MVDTWAEPYASYRASSTCRAVTPSAAARSRLISTLACGFEITRSLVTLIRSGSLRSSAESRLALSYSATRSGPWSVNWYRLLVRRPPIWVGGGVLGDNWVPGMPGSLRLEYRIRSPTLLSRPGRGLSLIHPPPRVNLAP